MNRVFVGIVTCVLCTFTAVKSQDRIDPTRIDIVRDKWGVPHIFAETNAEVAYGLAWAHAEDDFQTIQKCFLSSRSMLGMVNGREGAMVDYVVHLLHLRELVDSLYDKSVSPAFKKILGAYAGGLNSYADSHPREIFLKRLFPITSKDVLTYSVLQLAVGCGVDEALKQIYRGQMPNSHLLMENDPGGSNAFAFNSRITKDGGVYLAINTHHPLEGQVAWYEAHLSSDEGMNILGALFPGSPVIFTGINENLSWTHTVNHPDKLDVYQLQMTGANGNDYVVDGKVHTLHEETVRLKIKLPGFNLHVKRKVYSSIYGPTIKSSNGVFSIRTAGIMDIRGLEEWHRMNTASDFHEFKAALAMEALPGYNVMYADRFDTIYYISNGKLPIRNQKYDWSTTLPGNTTATLWSAFHPQRDLPQLTNPKCGFLFNANHSPFKASSPADNLDQLTFDPTMGYETHDNNRSLRFYELMKDREQIDFETFKKIKYDVTLPQALSYPVNIDSLFLLSEEKYPAISDLIATLKAWDRQGETSSVGAAVFAMAFYQVAAKYKADPALKFLSEHDCAETLQSVKQAMLRDFGTTIVTLGDYQRLVRGNKSMPLKGLPDVLAAMYSVPTKDGRVKGQIGDCYIAFVNYQRNGGPHIETVHNFGASNHPGSKHFDDQMPLYQKQITKPMTLSRVENYQQAEVIYHPHLYSRISSAKLPKVHK